jgi:hypothetical protein
MKSINITIKANSNQCIITCNGVAKEWIRTGNGKAESSDKINFEDEFDEDVAEVLDGISVLDLMYACGTYKQS